MNDAQWWYMEQLKRKTRSVESDLELVQRRLERAQDEPSKLRLKRELEYLDCRLNKLKRGLLY